MAWCYVIPIKRIRGMETRGLEFTTRMKNLMRAIEIGATNVLANLLSRQSKYHPIIHFTLSPSQSFDLLTFNLFLSCQMISLYIQPFSAKGNPL